MVEDVDGLYTCEECGLNYRSKETAESCEDFCRENNACDPEITALAVDG